MTEKTYQGSCHCGRVKFEARIDLERGSSKCNCSMCAKGRFWKAIIPADAFQLKAGKEELATYKFSSNVIHHEFCKHCGIKPYGHGDIPEAGGKFVAVNLACLDGVSAQELAGISVKFEDGAHDNWGSAPSETRYL